MELDLDGKSDPSGHLLQIITEILPFSYQTEQADPQREKRLKAVDFLTRVVQNQGHLMTNQCYEQFIFVFKKCLLTPLPPPLNPSGTWLDPEEDEPVLNPSWPLMQAFYALLLSMLASSDAQTLGNHLKDRRFYEALLQRMDSEDPRERELIKTTIHRIYGKYLNLRAPLRRSINAILQETVCDDANHKLSELLEIFGSIINGFAVPLRSEHVLFFRKTLLPLHCPSHLSTYYPQLAYCIVQFVEKEPDLGPPAIDYLIKKWPFQKAAKQVLCLSELEEILDILPRVQFNTVLERLFKFLTECMNSAHFQVAERAVVLWSGNDYVLSMLSELDHPSLHAIVRRLYKALEKSGKKHWNRGVQTMALAALTRLTQLDPLVYEECSSEAKDQSGTKDENFVYNAMDVENS